MNPFFFSSFLQLLNFTEGFFSFLFLFFLSTTPFPHILDIFFLSRPTHVHKALEDPNSGRQFASIAWVPGIGHLVRTTYPPPSIIYVSLFRRPVILIPQIPQEVPGILASFVHAALSSKTVPVSIPSKL